MTSLASPNDHAGVRRGGLFFGWYIVAATIALNVLAGGVLEDAYGRGRDELMGMLAHRGVESRAFFCPTMRAM